MIKVILLRRLLTIICVICLSILTISISVVVPSVSAHRSGCHRWHSCPSDSGSYVCGDTGYSSGCGGSIYTAPVINYTTQGLTNGKSHAVRDTASIESFAQTSGVNTGTEDGKINSVKSPLPQSTPTCDKVFTFDTVQDAVYVSSYKTGYKNECLAIFNSAYSSSYTTSYNIAKEAREAGIAKKKSDENAVWGWLIFGGIGVWIFFAIVKS